MPGPQVSVLVATSNRPTALERCLESVVSQTYTDMEVLVLDYSEKIDSCERVAGLDADIPVECTHVEEPYGVAGSRNWLMDRSTGDIMVFLDDDAAFADDRAIERAIEGFDSGVGIQAFKIVDNPGTDAERPVAPVPDRRMDDIDVDSQFRASYFVGAGHAIRREVIESCGDYRSDLMYGMEEMDLSYRAINGGWSISYNPSVVVHHHPADPVIDTASTGHPELYFAVANRIYFACRYLPYRYLVVHLCIWLGYQLVQAIRSGVVREYLTAIRRGIRLVRSSERTPVSGDALAYLRDNHGRLWY